MERFALVIGLIPVVLLSACAEGPAGTSHSPHSRSAALLPLRSDNPFRIPLKFNAKYSDNPPKPPIPWKQWPDVSDWQHFLIDHGYTTSMKIDGWFYLNTKAATRLFQAQHGVTPTTDGHVDMETYKAAVSADDPLPRHTIIQVR